MRAGGRVRVFESPDALAEAVARELGAGLQTAAARSRHPSLVLAGGKTPIPAYRRLAEAPWRAAVPWERLELFWTDERMVPPDAPASNYGMTWRSLLHAVPVQALRVHRIRGELGAREAVRVLDAELRTFFAGRTPSLDIVLLGLGSDGHTASLFPCSEALAARRRWVAVAEAPEEPRQRVTLTPILLRRARRILFMVSGRGKAAALARALEAGEDSGLPTARVRPRQGSVTWMVDREAASLLTSR